jgi:cytochrome c553
MKTVLLIISALFILGCSQEKQEEQQRVQTAEQAKVVAPAATEAKAVQKQQSPAAPEKTAPTVVQKEPVQKETVKKMPVVEVPAPKTEVVAKEVAVVDKTAVEGAKIFVKCAGCHGKNAEKKALGKSAVIRGWAPEKIVNAVHGYKAGTYGGAMKGVMKGQVANLNDDEINAVAKYISKL